AQRPDCGVVADVRRLHRQTLRAAPAARRVPAADGRHHDRRRSRAAVDGIFVRNRQACRHAGHARLGGRTSPDVPSCSAAPCRLRGPILDRGVRVLSMVAETADVSYFGDRQTGRTEARQDTQKFAEAALTDSKREGLLLAVRARWVALAVTAVTLPIINPNWEVIYYVLMLGLFALIGWAQLKVGKAGRSWPELFLMFCDLALLTFLSVVPNPWSTV